MIKPKTELELARELLESCEMDLFSYRKYEGTSPVIDANIRHKEEQIRQITADIKALEEEYIENQGGEQMRMV